MINHLIFDLDGTLLDTIEDIAFAINKALEECGYPQRYDRESTKYLIGDGADMLIRRALKEKGDDLRAFHEIKPIYMGFYKKYQTVRAKPFAGLKEALLALREKGVDFSVVTNKPEPLTFTILNMHFGESFFKEIIGASDKFPLKPDPAGVNHVMAKQGFLKEETLYVGDSHVDLDTADNAGLRSILCGWGYEVDYNLIKDRAAYYLAEPDDLIHLLS